MAAGWKRQRSRESTSARVPRWREGERGDFSGHPERHEAAEFPCFVSMLKAVFSFMNMHIWNLSRCNSRLLAGVLIESSCQLKTKRVLEWRVLFGGGGESEQWTGWPRLALRQQWDVKHQKQEGETFFYIFFLSWKDTFHCGGTDGSQSRSSLFYSSEFIRLIRRKIHAGKFWANSLERNQYPSILWAHHLPHTSQWDERGCFREKLWLVTPSLSCKTRCNEGLGLDPGAQSGWTNPVETLMRASWGRQCRRGWRKKRKEEALDVEWEFHQEVEVMAWIKALLMKVIKALLTIY